MSPTSKHFYRPDIDGLRAVAVLSVVIYHAGFNALPGGYVGVDVFFVISGYLITSIISREIGNNSFSILNFWSRRIRRIVPPLAVVLLSTMVGAWLLLFPNDFRAYCHSLIAQTVFASNMYFWTQTGYFATASEYKPLLHTWSLAVEEQFYLLLPCLLILTKSRTRHTHILILSVAIASSLAISIHWVSTSPATAFFWLPSRAWELLVGSLLVFLPKLRGKQLLCELTSAAGLALIIISCLFFDERTPFPGAMALMPCLGAAFIIYSHESGTVTTTSRLLSLKPIVYIGLISYSLYLWHWPLFAFARYYANGDLAVSVRLGLIALSFLLASISLKFIETPIRTKALLSGNKSLWAAAILFFGFCLSVGLIGHRSDGFPSRIDSAALDMYSGHQYTNPRRSECLFSEDREFSASEVCQIGSSGVSDDVGSDPTMDAVDFLLVGDSHANSIFPLMETLADKYGVTGLAPIYNGCPPVLTVYRIDSGNSHKCHEFNQSIIKLIKQKNIKHVMLVGRWSFYTNDQVLDQTEPDGTRPPNWLFRAAPSIEKSTQLVADGLNQLINEIDPAVSLYIFKQVPEQAENITPRFLANKIVKDEQPNAIAVSLEEHLKRQSSANAVLESIVDNSSREIALIDATPYLCGSDRCDITRDGGSLYRDGDHISTYGGQFIADAFDEFFSKIK